jgi:hypothetical protein
MDLRIAMLSLCLASHLAMAAHPPSDPQVGFGPDAELRQWWEAQRHADPAREIPPAVVDKLVALARYHEDVVARTYISLNIVRALAGSGLPPDVATADWLGGRLDWRALASDEAAIWNAYGECQIAEAAWYEVTLLCAEDRVRRANCRMARKGVERLGLEEVAGGRLAETYLEEAISLEETYWGLCGSSLLGIGREFASTGTTVGARRVLVTYSERRCVDARRRR